MPIPKKPVTATSGRTFTPRPGPAEEEVEQETGRGPTAPAGRSRADAFNQAEPENGLSLPVGNYTAHLVGAEKFVDGQKESVKFTYEIYEGELQGQSVPTWYNLFDKDGNLAKGVGYLKRDMEVLGGPTLNYDDLEVQLEQLIAERPLCNLTAKKNKGYTNIYLQGLAEGV